MFSLLTFSQLRSPDVLSAVTLSPLFNSLLCNSLYLCSVSLIAPPPHPPFFHLPLILFLLGHFPSIPDWTSPIFFSLFFSRLSLFYCFGSMRYLICFPSPLFNSVGQLYLSLYSLALLCLFPAFITSHLRSNYNHWIEKPLAISFATANVLWMSQNLWGEWNTAQFNLDKLSLFIRTWVSIMYSWCHHFQWPSQWVKPLTLVLGTDTAICAFQGLGWGFFGRGGGLQGEGLTFSLFSLSYFSSPFQMSLFSF